MQKEDDLIDSLTFTSLGFITLDSNEKNGYRARELKSISLGDITASFVKIIVHRCHDVPPTEDGESLNPFGQVGIVSLSLYANAKIQKGEGAVESNAGVAKDVNIEVVTAKLNGLTGLPLRSPKNEPLDQNIVQEESNIRLRMQELEAMKRERAQKEVRAQDISCKENHLIVSHCVFLSQSLGF